MKKFTFVLSVTIIFSCIEEDPAKYEEKLVVYASLTAGFPMGVLGDTCIVSLSGDIEEEKDPESLFISDAFVTLEAEGSTVIDTLFSVTGKPGRYLTRDSVIFNPGKTYKLAAIWRNYKVYSETKIPEKIEFYSPSNWPYICDGEEKEVDSVNTRNFDISWLQESDNFEDIVSKVDFTQISTAFYRDEGCYVGSFASFPLFLLDFNSKDYSTIQISSLALQAEERGLEPYVDNNNNGLFDNSTEEFIDYNKNEIFDSTFVNLIYDTTFVYQIWKEDYLRLDNGDPYRINPFVWQVVESPVPMSWLFFNYYGLHLITFSATDEAYYNYYSGDPVAQNQYLLPQGNIIDGYGLFYSKASKAFLVNIEPD